MDFAIDSDLRIGFETESAEYGDGRDDGKVFNRAQPISNLQDEDEHVGLADY